MKMTVDFFRTSLFEAVQMNRIFPDGKTFVDCAPKTGIPDILNTYEAEKHKPDFDLTSFVRRYFTLPAAPAVDFVAQSNATMLEHIESLWPALTRKPDTQQGSLIPLPYPYIVPGGRFREIYYWDSYFTLLGLQASGRTAMMEHMIQNFAHLINIIGYIPNGNRSYYLGRSQPPFFAMMVSLLAETKGEQVKSQYLPQLEKEYQFWMRGETELSDEQIALHHIVRMPDGSILNRFWDEYDTPRPESYREDRELAQRSASEPAILFRNLRAAAESGWDFSSRWFKDGKSLYTIHTTDIIPVDLNALLLFQEMMISEAYRQSGMQEKEDQYLSAARKRRAAMDAYCWNSHKNFYVDYDWKEEKQKEMITLAGMVPLFLFGVDPLTEYERVSDTIREHFLCAGGVVTATQHTGQQWDHPNGWAPLQWMTIIALEKMGSHELAKEIATRWLNLNNEVYKRTGKLMEKYNVIDMHLEAGGGEYPGQDGFGWTNGVCAALAKKYNINT
ncbi:alpha,alpha-trehalase [Hydrobacter penzbergensis]|uniref:Alpha,alpha-trehalase n=1 Tax=Hydrobacter penzbergensis TaxID=1235997 RepID=A0A8X8IEK5_9BACT|nr:alpha,alpha-trehalase TreF [Hydrobacter penzbergensis]SDW17775.1 alpha,alpha-trehalase [Hydrobacter penzbergensis]